MSYFCRYTASADWAQLDLERGHSFAEYQFFMSEQEARESDMVEFYGADVDDIRLLVHSNGTIQYGFALAGLCGFAIEMEDWESNNLPSYAGSAGYVALYEGRYVGQADSADGDMFQPIALIAIRKSA